MYVCVCVCERERERERGTDRERERSRERARESITIGKQCTHKTRALYKSTYIPRARLNLHYRATWTYRGILSTTFTYTYEASAHEQKYLHNA